ncbi:MAG: NAD(P)-binding domain-containing protein, partial [Bdellovibrionales bacterium]|nr:NAD(P)-binding domain-containing protein [Bdellovibrionales bacterium]
MAEEYKIAIIGAGPGGLGAASNCAYHGISHILFEKREIGNTVYDYQLKKHVMAEPAKLPLRSHIQFEAGTREQVLQTWNQGVESLGVNLRKAEVLSIKKEGERFLIGCSVGTVYADSVILSIGMQGTPRKLGVPGDDSSHVAYTLADPEALADLDIVVVGAGDAAIENALALIENNRVSIVNRGDEFARAKDANNSSILKAIEAGKLRCFYNSSTKAVTPEFVVIDTPDGEVQIKCDHLIARIGAIMPRKFLEQCGIQFSHNGPEALPLVDQNFQSNIEGLYIIGALVG